MAAADLGCRVQRRQSPRVLEVRDGRSHAITQGPRRRGAASNTARRRSRYPSCVFAKRASVSLDDPQTLAWDEHRVCVSDLGSRSLVARSGTLPGRSIDALGTRLKVPEPGEPNTRQETRRGCRCSSLAGSCAAAVKTTQPGASGSAPAAPLGRSNAACCFDSRDDVRLLGAAPTGGDLTRCHAVGRRGLIGCRSVARRRSGMSQRDLIGQPLTAAVTAASHMRAGARAPAGCAARQQQQSGTCGRPPRRHGRRPQAPRSSRTAPRAPREPRLDREDELRDVDGHVVEALVAALPLNFARTLHVGPKLGALLVHVRVVQGKRQDVAAVPSHARSGGRTGAPNGRDARGMGRG